MQLRYGYYAEYQDTSDCIGAIKISCIMTKSSGNKYEVIPDHLITVN